MSIHFFYVNLLLKHNYFFFRAAQFRKSDSYASIESQNLSMFLATNDIIRTNLKKALDDPEKGVPGYDEILCDVINTSVQMFENKLYLLPQEKHILVKVIGFSLSLLDGEFFNINKLDGKKRINLSQIDKIFKVLILNNQKAIVHDFKILVTAM
jgi:cytoplasmic FMR1 interacting protein